jgi:hypothetical protein
VNTPEENPRLASLDRPAALTMLRRLVAFQRDARTLAAPLNTTLMPEW